MQNLGLCENLTDIQSAADTGQTQRLQNLAEKAREASGDGELKELAREFSEVFYTILLKQMEKTIDREEESAVSEGVTGFVNMYLPKAIAGAESDPLTGRIQNALQSQFGRGENHGDKGNTEGVTDKGTNLDMRL